MVKKIIKAIIKEAILLGCAVFIMWIAASWYDTMVHNGPNGDLNFWKYNAFVLLTEMR